MGSIIATDADPDGNKRMIINKGDGAVQNLDIVLTDTTFASFYHDFKKRIKTVELAIEEVNWEPEINHHAENPTAGIRVGPEEKAYKTN